MPKYLTINQYKRFDDGMSLTNISDLALTLTISRAEAAIDAFMGFDAKRGGLEPHFVMIQHQFEQHELKTWFPNYAVPVRQITRYRIQVSNLSTTGAGFFANISPNDCVITNDGNYVEIVPLQAVTYSLSPVLIQLGLRPPIVEMDCEIGFYIPVFGEAFFNQGDSKTYYATNGFWATTYTQALASQPNQLPPVPPVIYANGVALSSSLYTVNAVDGSIVFSAPRASGDVITGDYTYTIPDYIQEACILQVAYIVGQRALNKTGMQGLESAKSGDQDVRRPRRFPIRHLGDLTQHALCEEAMSVLSRYVQVAIA